MTQSSPVASLSENVKLLGQTKAETASIVQWISFADTELLGPIGTLRGGIIGYYPYTKPVSPRVV